jgi:hypothetical protein
MKKPKYVMLADKKKLYDIDDLLKMKKIMIENNVSELEINNYVDKQYIKINKDYTDKIKKYEQKYKARELKKERQDSIDFLIKNKNFLEEYNVKDEYINRYVEIQYNRINEKFNDTVQFLD